MNGEPDPYITHDGEYGDCAAHWRADHNGSVPEAIALLLPEFFEPGEHSSVELSGAVLCKRLRMALDAANEGCLAGAPASYQFSELANRTDSFE